MLYDQVGQTLRLKQKKGLIIQPLFQDQASRLLDDLGDHAGTNGTAAYA